MKSVGRTQYFLNPYTFTNNTADVRTEFYNLRSNGNLEQILTKSRRRNPNTSHIAPPLHLNQMIEGINKMFPDMKLSINRSP